MKYDIIILGSGPAAYSAAVSAIRRNKTVLIVGNDPAESPLAKAAEIDNYIGMPAISGLDMLRAFADHAKKSGAEIITGRVNSVIQQNSFMLLTGDNIYEGSALILAQGVVRQKKFEGEEAMLGKGVSYCATCDGFLYRGKKVLVYGTSAESAGEALFLKDLGCDVTFICEKKPDGLSDTIPFIQAVKPSVHGSDHLEYVEYEPVSAIGTREKAECSGFFILRSAIAPSDLFPGLEVDGGFIAVDKNMATNIPGIYAAGDCVGEPFQIAKAVGEGQVAALSAVKYLDTQTNTQQGEQ